MSIAHLKGFYFWHRLVRGKLIKKFTYRITLTKKMCLLCWRRRKKLTNFTRQFQFIKTCKVSWLYFLLSDSKLVSLFFSAFRMENILEWKTIINILAALWKTWIKHRRIPFDERRWRNRRTPNKWSSSTTCTSRTR